MTRDLLKEFVRLTLLEGGTPITIPSEWVEKIYEIAQALSQDPEFMQQAEMSIPDKNSVVNSPLGKTYGGICRMQFQINMRNTALPASIRRLFTSNPFRNLEVFLYASFLIDTGDEEGGSFGISVPGRKRRTYQKGGMVYGNNPEIHIAILREDLASIKGRSSLRSIIQHELVHMLQYAAAGASWEDSPIKNPNPLWGMTKEFLGSKDIPEYAMEEIEPIAAEISKKVEMDLTSLYRKIFKEFKEKIIESPESAMSFFEDAGYRRELRNDLINNYVKSIERKYSELSPETLDYIKRRILRDASNFIEALEDVFGGMMLDALRKKVAKLP